MLVGPLRDNVYAQFGIQPLAQLLRWQVEFGEWQDRSFDIVRALLMAFAGLAPETFRCVKHAFAEHKQRAGGAGEVIEQGFGVFKEQRQVKLDARWGHALLDVLVQRAATWIDREALAQGVAERLCRFLGQRELARRQQAHRIDLVVGTLRFRVEGADRVDLVIEQLDAVRLGAAHREDVEQRATHRKIAGFLHLRHVAIAGHFEPALLAGDIEFLLEREYERGARDITARRESLHQGRHRHDQHAAFQRRQAIQRRDALRDDLRVRREQVVGQGFPVRKLEHLQITAGEHRQFRFERVRGVRIVRDRDDNAVVGAPGLGECQRECGAIRRGPVAALPGRGWQGRFDQRGRHGGREREQRMIAWRALRAPAAQGKERHASARECSVTVVISPR